MVTQKSFKIRVDNPVTGLPAWRQGMAQWEWRAIPGSALSSVQPAPQPGGYYSARIDAWCGLAAGVDGKVWIAANGGHADYAGNEVIGIDLMLDVPSWGLLRDPTPMAQVSTNETHYADGRPTSSHTYYSLHHIAARGRVFRFSFGSAWGDGNFGRANVDAFDLASNDWDAKDSWAPVPGGVNIARSIAKNAVNENVYTIGANFAVQEWEEATATWRARASVDNNHDYAASAVDTLRNRVFWVGSYGGAPAPLLFDIAGNTASYPALSGSTAGFTGGYNCMEYEPSLDRFILKNSSGGEVVLVDPSTFAFSLQPVTGAGLLPNAVNGVNGRFRHVAALGGCVYYPKYSAGMWFLRTAP